MREIKEKAEFCFLKLFEEVHNERPHLAVQVQTGEPNEPGTYFKPIFSDLKNAIFIVNQFLETVRAQDHFIFYCLLDEFVKEAIDRDPNERTSEKLEKKSVKRWRRIKIELSNWLNLKSAPPDTGEDDLFIDKDAEKLFMQCGIKNDVFSATGKFRRKKGFVYGMIEAFYENNLIKISSSRSAIKIYFDVYLGSSYKDPRKSQTGVGSITFQRGYEAAIKCLEGNYKHP